MRSEWISVQIECHSPRGTEVHRGVFPASNVVSIQVSSISAVIAQVWEAVSLMEGGQITSIDISLSLPMSVELDATEAALLEKYKKKRGADRFDRFFEAVNVKGGSSNG